MKEIEMPFGAKDSELKGWEYTIPEGMEAEIKDGKIVVREKKSDDERIRKELIEFLDGVWHLGKNANFDKWGKADCAKWIAWLKAGFHKGKEEALKGMPKWKKADGGKKYPSCLVREKDGNGDYWYRLSVGKIYDGYEYILVSELEKLPHE